MQDILDTIAQAPVLPVYYNDDLGSCIQVLEACYTGGIRVFEFVNRGTHAATNFESLMAYKKENMPDLKLGIGTIKTKSQAQQFLDLGAEFIVSPIFNAAIATCTIEQGILWIPGCMTPSEIAQAEELGVPLVKLFPGDVLGTTFLKAIKPVFPNLKFMPTGGVGIDAANIQAWRQAGVFAVGLGSKLLHNTEHSDDYSWLTARCQHLLSAMHAKL